VFPFQWLDRCHCPIDVINFIWRGLEKMNIQFSLGKSILLGVAPIVLIEAKQDSMVLNGDLGSFFFLVRHAFNKPKKHLFK
jgi:hypothetical protein